MATNVERSDSQRSQSNGPRVSFNRDVHVKRIGLRPNELPNYPILHVNYPQSAQLRRELPKDLSKEGILKEAALVLSQAEKVKCVAESGGDTASGRGIVRSRGALERKNKSDDNPDWFHSLPTRKKKRNLVNRSSSDASTKKHKKPSIFSIFSRKSESNLDQVDNSNQPTKKLTRAKSDVSDLKALKATRKTSSSETDDATGNLKSKGQLSPIIENLTQENIFEKSDKLKRTKPRKGFKSPEKYLPVNNPPSGNIGFTNVKDLDLVPSKPISEISSLPVNSTLGEGIHSSQLPPKKPPLTKGLMVDGMVKRLSMDRFSPPPQLHGPAFSYTRPNDYVVYAGVAYDNDAKSKQTVHSRFTKSDSSPVNDIKMNDSVDSRSPRSIPNKSDMASQTNIILYKNIQNHERSLSPVQHLRPSPTSYDRSTSPATYSRQSPIRQERSYSPVPPLRRSPHRHTDPVAKNYHRGHSDEDEGVGLDTKQDFEEPPIVPRISPNRTHLLRFADTNGEKTNEFNNLSNRRKQLESRIISRRVGSLERLLEQDNTSPSKDVLDRAFEKDPIPSDNRNRSHDRYRREMSVGVDGIPISREFQIRNRLNSPSACREIDLGYIEDNYHYQNTGHLEPDTSYFQEKYRQEFEPKSLEDEFCELSRSLPESRMMDKYHQQRIADQTENHHGSYMVSSLKRDKKKNRYLDKGDSGIENDFRKDPYGDDHRIRWKYRTLYDDMEDTDLFLKRERQHTEMLHMKRYNYIFRERSIDDGSHFDPRLDKYPSRHERSVERSRRDEKKIGGLEKVKQLFTNTLKKKPAENRKEKTEKDKYMIREEEMRRRYREHKGSEIDVKSTKFQSTDIALRRRLSTPKASPLPKRTPSQKSSKSSNVSVQTDSKQKSNWFKSLDRLSRKKSESSSKSNSIMTDDAHSTLKPISRQTTNASRTTSNKNLRFFGDTDIESNIQYGKSHSTNHVNKTKKSLLNSTLTKNQKYSQSANALNGVTNKSKDASPTDRYRSSSLHNLDNQNTARHNERNTSARSSEQQDVSDATTRSDSRHYQSKYDSDVTFSHKTNQRNEVFGRSGHEYNDEERGRPRERSPWTPTNYHYDRAGSECKKPPTGPQKPARTLSRRKTASRDRDRVHDSSGTEGDSSQQSQRSVVYLHATTVGSIPQPYIMNGRRTASRDDLSTRSKKLEPMTKTVSRSFSVLAPWKPKHPSEGYEIHYSPAHEPNIQPVKQRKDRSSSLTRSRKQSSKDDLQSVRNSSLTSNSSPLPYRNKERELKKPILSRNRRKENI